MCCICWLLCGRRKPRTCRRCGERVVVMRFTRLGMLCCFGGTIYCCIGMCCLFLLRQRHCPLCYKHDFEEIARVRRRIQCLVDDKSELYIIQST